MRLAALAWLLALAACPAPPANEATPPAPTPAPRAPDATLEARRTETLDRFFQDELSGWMVRLSGDPETTRPAIPEVDAAVRATLDALFTATETVARWRRSDPGEAPDLSPLVTRVNNALHASGLGYALDSVVLDGAGDELAYAPVLFSFTVESAQRYRHRDRELVVSRARRFDRLAYRYQLIGFTTPNRRPLVLLDAIEELIATGLFGTSEIPSTIAAPSVADAVTAAARREAANADELAAALVARRALFTRWQQRHPQVAWQLPTTRVIDYPYRKMLAGVIPEDELDELDRIEARLSSVAASAAFSALREVIAGGTDQHELQHQLDLEAPLRARDSSSSTTDKLVLGECSAILAEIARSPRAAHFSLARLARVALSTRESTERAATRLAVGAIAGDGDKRGEELEVQLKSLALRTPAELAAAATSAWRRLFGGELASLEPVQAPGVHGSPKALQRP